MGRIASKDYFHLLDGDRDLEYLISSDEIVPSNLKKKKYFFNELEFFLGRDLDLYDELVIDV